MGLFHETYFYNRIHTDHCDPVYEKYVRRRIFPSFSVDEASMSQVGSWVSKCVI